MEILFLLIPLAIIIAFIIAGLFFWSVRSGQFDDMQGPAHSIIMDDDEPDPTLNTPPEDRQTSSTEPQNNSAR